MPTKVIMPQMGESIFEGTITKWLKKPGDVTSRDEPLFEISTDKVDSEIPSPASGIVQAILVPEGKTVQINTVVALIAGSDEASEATPRLEPKLEPSPIAAPAAEAVEAAKPASSDRAEAAPASADLAPSTAVQPIPAVIKSAAPVVDVRTSPLVRRMAREHGIDLSLVKGTGLAGRITKQDILDRLQQALQPQAAVSPQGPALAPATPSPVPIQELPPTPEPSKAPQAASGEAPKFVGETEVVPMTTMRKAIADHMVLSKRTSAHVNTVFEVDVTSIAQLRERYKDEFEKREGTKLTLTPFFAKALVDTVREFPIFNCSVAGESIVYKKQINVGIAVALETGLIVPVIKDAHLKSFTGIALAIGDLANRARTKRLKPDEVQNGTISITNPGIYGGLFGTPIISQPQVAILGIGGVEKRPVVINDAIAIRSMVYLSLSFDHRVIDGAVADQFMASLKKRLESWSKWID